jgi:hypothetical protein
MNFEKLRKLREAYQKRSIKMPEFIDTQSNLDYYVYAYYREILNCILALIMSDNHSKKSINLLIDKANENMDNIFRAYDSKSNEMKYILLCEKIISFMEDLEVDLVEGEFYEAAANLKKFEEKFYRVDNE